MTTSAYTAAISEIPPRARTLSGPDPADIAFAGIFTGPDAADRSRLLDALRVAGAPLSLTWDAFLYTVVIANFEADYRSPWWIPYRLSCSVLRDEAAAIVSALVQLAPAVSSDLASAGSFAASASAAMTVPGATTMGTAAYASAQTALATTIGSLDSRIVSTGSGLRAPDLATVIGSAGLLAQLTIARGYTARAARNLSNAST